jgi:VIT1/CCC1 family predicted Fe2+/Mn2+ transporter
LITRRLDEARQAYKNKDVIASRAAHDPTKIGNEVWHKTGQGKYIGSAIYGASDGIITTFAVVAGVAGAGLSVAVVLILGLANLIGDGLSMAIGDFLSGRAERKYQKSEEERELWEIENHPEGEREEVRQIYKNKGLEGETLENLVAAITSNKSLWIHTMMTEELGIYIDEDSSPLNSAVVTFISFVVAGFMPLLAYVLSSRVPIFAANQFLAAVMITGITLFTVGAARVFVTGEKWYLGGLEMLVVGGISASAAYFIGFLLKGIAGTA